MKTEFDVDCIRSMAISAHAMANSPLGLAGHEASRRATPPLQFIHTSGTSFLSVYQLSTKNDVLAVRCPSQMYSCASIGFRCIEAIAMNQRKPMVAPEFVANRMLCGIRWNTDLGTVMEMIDYVVIALVQARRFC